jgi:hypothetical protein
MTQKLTEVLRSPNSPIFWVTAYNHSNFETDKLVNWIMGRNLSRMNTGDQYIWQKQIPHKKFWEEQAHNKIRKW